MTDPDPANKFRIHNPKRNNNPQDITPRENGKKVQRSSFCLEQGVLDHVVYFVRVEVHGKGGDDAPEARGGLAGNTLTHHFP